LSDTDQITEPWTNLIFPKYMNQTGPGEDTKWVYEIHCSVYSFTKISNGLLYFIFYNNKRYSDPKQT